MVLYRKNPRIVNFIKGFWAGLDKPLFFAVVAISAFSAFNIYGISGSFDAVVRKQVIVVAFCLCIMMLFSFFNYRYFRDYPVFVLSFFIGSLGLLFLTFYSHAINGSRAWINIGNFVFEPSELAKLALIIILAKYFSQRHIYINQVFTLLVSGTYFLLPTSLVLLQPDLGSAIILGLIWVGILIVSGLNRKQVFALVTMAVLMSYGAWLFALKPYQKDRIASFVNPYNDPQGAGYNLIQSKIAIGSSYILGNGWNKGTQAKLGFLPEAYNDFVFASAVEQFGFVGAIGILGTLMLIIYRIIVIGGRATTNFGKLFSIGLVIFLLGHIVINIGANIGLLPITGIPLPFLSYGGSNLFSIMIGIGILQSIKRYG